MSTSVIRPHLRNVHKRPLPAQVLCARICIHNKESLIAVGARDGVIRVYAFDSVSLQSSWENTSSHSSSAACAVTALTFYITDVICIIAGNDRGELIVWNVSRESKIRTLDHRHRGAIRHLRIEQHHHVLASVAADGRLILWDLLQGKRRQVHRDTSSALTSVCFARNGKWVMTGSEDGNVRIYDIMRGVLFCTLCAPSSNTCNTENNVSSVNGAAQGNGEGKREKLSELITCTEFHPEREIVATGSSNGHLCIWDWQHSVLLHHCYIAELTSISALCFCQNRLLTTSERVMYFYTISKTFEHERICTECYNVYDLCYNNEKNEILVSCCCDNAVLLTGHWPLEHSLVESIDYENDFADYGSTNTNVNIDVDNDDNNIHRRVVDCEQATLHKQQEAFQSSNFKKENNTNLQPVPNASENTIKVTNQQLLNKHTSLVTNSALDNGNVIGGRKMPKREKVTVNANYTGEINDTTTPKVSHEKLSIEPELVESMMPACSEIDNKIETTINNNNINSSQKVSNNDSVKESKEKITLTSPTILNESSTSLQTNKSAQRDVSDVGSHHKVVNRDKKDVQAELVQEGDATCKVLIERLEQLKMIREEWAEEPEEALQYLIGLHGDGWESIVCDFFTAIVESKLVLTIDMLPTILTLFESLLRQDANVLGTQPKLAALRVLRVLNAQLRPWIEREICKVKQLHNNLQVHEYKLQEERQQQRRLSSLHSQEETLHKKDDEVHLQGCFITNEKSSNTKVKNTNERVQQDVNKYKNGNAITVSANKKVNNAVDSNCYPAKNVYDELTLLKMREELDECTRDALELLNEPGSYQEELRRIIDDLQALSE